MCQCKIDSCESDGGLIILLVLMFDSFFKDIPPVTRLILVVQIIGLGLISLKYMDRYEMYFNFQKIIYEGQPIYTKIWRLVTSLFYIRNFNVFVVFELILSYQMLKNLERGFSRGSIDFLYIMAVLTVSLYALGVLLSINYLGILFKHTVYYLYGRTNSDQFLHINLIPIRAPYLIWVLIFFDWLMDSAQLKSYIISVLLGHTLFYLISIYPHLYLSRKQKPLDTPLWFIELVSPFFKEEDRIQQRVGDQIW